MAAAKKPPCEDWPNQLVTMLPCIDIWRTAPMGALTLLRSSVGASAGLAANAARDAPNPAASAPAAAAAVASQRRRVRRGVDDVAGVASVGVESEIVLIRSPSTLKSVLVLHTNGAIPVRLRRHAAGRRP